MRARMAAFCEGFREGVMLGARLALPFLAGIGVGLMLAAAGSYVWGWR